MTGVQTCALPILQKIDVGIALCHFMAGLEEQGEKPDLILADPGLDVPENAEYIATVRRL